jgi:hypothetical protein
MKECRDRLREMAHATVGAPRNVHRDNVSLARDLARLARTVDELNAARMLISFSFFCGPVFEHFMRESYVPAFNQIEGSRLRCCPECWRAFPPNDSRDRFCNSTCGARSRNRGVQRVGSGKSATETALARLRQRAKRHATRCPDCKSRTFCQTNTDIWNAISAADALAHRNPVADVEDSMDRNTARAWEAVETAEIEEEDPVRRLRDRAK